MSERELRRVEALPRIVEGRMSVVGAAEALSLSSRQAQRLLAASQIEGAPALRHGASGWPPNTRLHDGIRNLGLAGTVAVLPNPDREAANQRWFCCRGSSHQTSPWSTSWFGDLSPQPIRLCAAIPSARDWSSLSASRDRSVVHVRVRVDQATEQKARCVCAEGSLSGTDALSRAARAAPT